MSDNMQIAKQFYAQLDAGERLSLIGVVIEQSAVSQNLALLIPASLVGCVIMWMLLITTFHSYDQFVRGSWAYLGGLSALAFVVGLFRKKRRIARYIALTNRRLLGLDGAGVYTVSLKDQVHKIEGRRDRVSFYVNEARASASEEDVRLGCDKRQVRLSVQQIRGMPVLIGQQEPAWNDVEKPDQ